MSKVNRIRIYFLFAVILMLGILQLIKYNTPTREEAILPQASVEPVEKKANDSKEYVPAIKKEEYKYIVLEEEDYLTIYFADMETVYEYTDIQYSSLPDTLRQKIRNGYCIKDEAELFGFLENYSS